MSGPPDDISAGELFQHLLQRPRPSEVVPFAALDKPGKKGEIRIQVLPKEEHDRARFAAHQALKKASTKYGIASLSAQDMQSPAVAAVESDLSACEVLSMACLRVEPSPGYTEEDSFIRYARVFPDGESVGKTLSADEVAYLFAAYNLIQYKYGPHEATCLPEDVNVWVRRLVEGAADLPFLRLSSPQWAEMLTAFAQKLHDLGALLESQWSSLPDSLKSDLATYCLEPTSVGEPAENTSDPILPGARGELSFEQAMRLANSMRGQSPSE